MRGWAAGGHARLVPGPRGGEAARRSDLLRLQRRPGRPGVQALPEQLHRRRLPGQRAGGPGHRAGRGLCPTPDPPPADGAAGRSHHPAAARRGSPCAGESRPGIQRRRGDGQRPGEHRTRAAARRGHRLPALEPHHPGASLSNGVGARLVRLHRRTARGRTAVGGRRTGDAGVAAVGLGARTCGPLHRSLSAEPFTRRRRAGGLCRHRPGQGRKRPGDARRRSPGPGHRTPFPGRGASLRRGPGVLHRGSGLDGTRDWPVAPVNGGRRSAGLPRRRAGSLFAAGGCGECAPPDARCLSALCVRGATARGSCHRDLPPRPPRRAPGAERGESAFRHFRARSTGAGRARGRAEHPALFQRAPLPPPGGSHRSARGEPPGGDTARRAPRLAARRAATASRRAERWRAAALPGCRRDQIRRAWPEASAARLPVHPPGGGEAGTLRRLHGPATSRARLLQRHLRGASRDGRPALRHAGSRISPRVRCPC